MRSRPPLSLALVATLLAACETRAPAPDRAATTTTTAAREAAAPRRQIVFEPAAEGDLAPLVVAARDRAAADHRRLLVYVGATWCEPCQRFHRAAEAGAVDPALGELTMLELDLDRDEARLAAAGYASKYIPLFAIPDASGRAGPLRIEGSIKGQGAVAEITPRLRRILAAP